MASSARQAVGRAVKVTAATVDRLRAPSSGIVVLLYHRVGRRSSSEVDLNAGVFDDQMAFLAQATDVLPLGAALAELAEPASEVRRRPRSS